MRRFGARAARRAICRIMAMAAVVLSATILAAAPAQAQASRAVAIVVHPDTRVDALTFDELRRIFHAQQQFWRDGSRITLLVRAPVAEERKLVLERIYRMTEDQYRQFWISKMFRAETASGPKIVYSSEMARELVTAIPGAITFIPLSAVTPGLKVVRIDGALPTDARYPLK